MNNLQVEEVQSVLDSYSVGKIVKSNLLDTTTFSYKEDIILLNKALILTSHGLYLLVFAENGSIHSLWWDSKNVDMEKYLLNVLNLKHAILVLTNSNTKVVHKYDLRLALFEL